MAFNSMNAGEVNKLYVHLKDFAAAGFTGRKIDIERGNAAPDSTSGGYNGADAKAVLLSRGFSITSY